MIVALAAASCSSGPQPIEDAATYQSRIEEKRAAKDKSFRAMASDSSIPNDQKPVPSDKRDDLLPLLYFPVYPRYNVPSSLMVAEAQPEYEMPTSTGRLRKMRQVGVLEFSLEGQPLTLGAFVDATTADLRQLFVPFSDLTTGKETYDAGRYLDIDRTATGIYAIDFNDAYNPYCAYNATYDCPFPPPANRLKIRVQAGERVKARAGGPAAPPGQAR